MFACAWPHSLTNPALDTGSRPDGGTDFKLPVQHLAAFFLAAALHAMLSASTSEQAAQQVEHSRAQPCIDRVAVL
jgi:hypothetical protein